MWTRGRASGGEPPGARKESPGVTPRCCPKATLHGFLRPQVIFGHYFPHRYLAPRSLNRPGTKDGRARLSGAGLPPTQRPGREPLLLRRDSNASKEAKFGTMLQIKIRWGDLGSPVEPGTYRCGPHIVEVTPGDIKLAKSIRTRCSPRSIRIFIPIPRPIPSPASIYRQLIPRLSAAAAVACP